MASLITMVGCATNNQLASAAAEIVKANASSQADVSLDIILPQGTIHWHRFVPMTNSPATK